MHSLRFLVIALSAASIHADLNCFVWDALVLVYGLICHFKPKVYDAAANASLNALAHAFDEAKAIGKFDLEVWPVHMAYKFVELQQTQGSLSAEAYLSHTADDIGEVSLGVAKETTNQAFQILGLEHWRDVAYCILGGASISIETMRRGKRAPATVDALKLAKDCSFSPDIPHASFNISSL